MIAAQVNLRTNSFCFESRESVFFLKKWDSKQGHSRRRFSRSFDSQVKAGRLRMGEVPTIIFMLRMPVPVMHNFLVQLMSTLRGESSTQLRVL
jgi:hypothetical protein